MVMQMPDGAYRMYLFNDHEDKMHRVFVKAKSGELKDVKIISKYPVLPPRYVEQPTGKLHHIFGKVTEKHGFEITLQPGGVSIVDVYLA